MLIKTVFGCGQMSPMNEGIKVSSSLEALVSVVWKKTESIPPPPLEEHSMDTPSPRANPRKPQTSQYAIIFTVILTYTHCYPSCFGKD